MRILSILSLNLVVVAGGYPAHNPVENEVAEDRSGVDNDAPAVGRDQ